jgi:DnaK suppressor protein
MALHMAKKTVRKKTAKKTAKKGVKKAVKKAKAKTAKTTKTAKTAKKAKPAKNKAAPKAATKKSRKPAKSGVTLPPDYAPSEHEEFMNPIMLQYFERKLKNWRADLLSASNVTLLQLQEGNEFEPDIADRATTETNRALELRTRDRARKLIAKIDSALERIAVGSYGYCEETGEPISLNRLEARPIATLSLEAQERHERMEKTHRDE